MAAIYTPTSNDPYGQSFRAGWPQPRTLADVELEFSERINNLELATSKLNQSMAIIDKKMDEILAYLKSGMATSQENISTSKVIIVEEMDKATAKQKVFDFIKEHKTSDIEELHENIRCDIGVLITIIDELCAEGLIGGED